jgi:3-keto-5-aminohexanoate cleavage enzyme
MSDRVDWPKLDQISTRFGHGMVWTPYGYPEIVDPLRSALVDAAVMPRWDVPETVFINTAITGAFFSRKGNEHQPIRPEEIRQSAAEAIQAGAPAIHIHVRDERGYSTLSPELFEEVIRPLRDRYPHVLFDGCLVPAVKGEWERIPDVLAAGLLDCVPVNATAAFFGDALFAMPPHLMIEKAVAIQEAGAKVQVAVYTDADVDNAHRYLIRSGVLEKPYLWIVLPALPGCSPMHNPRQMVDGLLRITRAIQDIDPTSIIVVCAAGRASTYLTALALILGLHVRVGMEDTVWLWPHRDDPVTSNAQHFSMASQLAGLLGRRVQTEDETRQLFGLRDRSS